mmetsp:Transcript_24498/g.74744  ORF Transcript_24498/g.74744 Transcript_24498/m.74744 type:complete len:247 (+) Transcript_24498:3746-4486(+)
MARRRVKTRACSAAREAKTSSCAARRLASSDRIWGMRTCRCRSCSVSSSPHSSSNLAEARRPMADPAIVELPSEPAITPAGASALGPQASPAGAGGRARPSAPTPVCSSTSAATRAKSARSSARTDSPCTRSAAAARSRSSAGVAGACVSGASSSVATAAWSSDHCSANCAALEVRLSALSWQSASHARSRSSPQQSRSDAPSAQPSRRHTAGSRGRCRSASTSASNDPSSCSWSATVSSYKVLKY